MIVSLNWLKKFTSIDIPVEELAKLIGERLVEIEDVINLSDKYRDIVVVRVVECGRMENSDHLNVTKVDDGGVVADVERDENGLVQVVCGANNVRTGMLAAWLPPRSIVPETYKDETPFVLGSRNLRGVTSNGMLASARELDLYNEHEGILDIDKDAQPGERFAEIYELNDILLDIENKSLTHRPDTFGIIGFAREVAGILNRQFTTPDWFLNPTPIYDDADESLDAPKVSIDGPELSDRYQAVVLSSAESAAKSPIEIQTYLARVGIRPINAVVDVTNYLMILTGQPLHAFDYDKVVAISGGEADIHVRSGREGEKLELLDGREIQLSEEDVVIAAGDTAVGLAGAMGGASTLIDQHTKNIILESATFNLYRLRSTQMRHGIFSEAITRFTKGQPPELTAPVLAEAIRLMDEWVGAKRVSGVADVRANESSRLPIELTISSVNCLLGTDYSTERAAATLRHVEFTVEQNNDHFSVSTPYWRNDIHIAEDVIEEIGRLNGYDEIIPTLPARDFRAVQIDEFDQLKALVRSVLARSGANEVLTYSFVHGDVLRRGGQDSANSFKIINSLSPDLQYYRQSLTPSLLGLVHPNIKAGFDEFALFEINKVHDKATGMNDENVPVEHHALSLVIAGKKSGGGAAFYQAKVIMEFVATELGLRLAYEPLGASSTSPMAAPFQPKRSAIVTDKTSGEYIGILGEYAKTTSRNFKLPEYVAGFELDCEALLRAHQKTSRVYVPLSRFPGTERDVSFLVSTDTTYEAIVTAVTDALKETGLESEIIPRTIYSKENSEKKTITLRLQLTPTDKTLTSDDVSQIMAKVAETATQATGAAIV